MNMYKGSAAWGSYMLDLTSSVTLFSIALSSRPTKKLAWCNVERKRFICTTQWHHLLLSELWDVVRVDNQTLRVYGGLPYLAQTLGSTFKASLIMIGVWGLCFFIVGYVRRRNCLCKSLVVLWMVRSGNQYRAAALCSDVWHRWNLSSFKPCAKTYLVAIWQCEVLRVRS